MAAAAPVISPTTTEMLICFFIDRVRKEADINVAVADNLKEVITGNGGLLTGGMAEPKFGSLRTIICRLARTHREKTVGLKSVTPHNSQAMNVPQLMMHLNGEAQLACSGAISWPVICYVIEMTGQAVAESAGSVGTRNRCIQLVHWTVAFFLQPLPVGGSIQSFIDAKPNKWEDMRTVLADWKARGIPALECDEKPYENFDCQKAGGLVHCTEATCPHTCNERNTRDMKQHIRIQHRYISGLVNNCTCGVRKVRGVNSSSKCTNCGRLHCLVGTCVYENSTGITSLMIHFKYHPGQTPVEPQLTKTGQCTCGSARDLHGRCLGCLSYTCTACAYMRKRKYLVVDHFKKQHP